MSSLPYWQNGPCKYDCLRCGVRSYFHQDFIKYRINKCDICSINLEKIEMSKNKRKKEKGEGYIYYIDLCNSPKCDGKMCPKCHNLFCSIHIYNHVISCKGTSIKLNVERETLI